MNIPPGCDVTKTTFVRCPKNFLGAFAIPDGITRIADQAFEECEALASVHIPDGSISFIPPTTR